MFEIHAKHALSASQSLELIQFLLSNARDKEPPIRFVLCNYAKALLESMKEIVKRTSIDNKDGNQSLREGIASAYLDHANLVADLGHPDQAQTSRRKADKWGGPGIKKDAAPPVKQASKAMDIATLPSSIFPNDVSPFTTRWTFPELDGRMTDTPQLVSCLSLLKQDSDGLPEEMFERAARKWLNETAENMDERARLEALATDLIRAFTRDEIKDRKVITEVLCLVPVLEEEDVRFLLRHFLNNIEGSNILDIGALRGLAQLLRTAAPGYLHAQDLIKVLGPMSTRLQETHTQSPDQIFELTVAVSSVLDAMADTKVAGLDREGLHEPLLAFLRNLQKSEDPQLRYYAAYAFQGLLCVPDDESPWKATMRRTTKVVKGISGLVSAVKGLDLNGFMAGLKSIQEGFEGVQQVFELTKTAYEGVSAVYEGEQDLIESLKEGLKLNRKRAWYSAIRGADTLIEGGELAKLKVLVCGAPCRREIAFQWGICQRLGGIAANKLWGDKTRQGALKFLEEIYRNDSMWGQNLPIKAYILEILRQLSITAKDIPEAGLLLEDLATDGDAEKLDSYRQVMAKDSNTSPRLLILGSLELASPSLMDRVQQKTDVEAELRHMARMRIKERAGTVYVPPMAKAYLQASDDTSFDLIPMVDEYLNGDQKVFLLLGDSGAGKTMFNRELDLKLWKAYLDKPHKSRIPLLISLPAIDRPEKDLIAKHLRIHEFTEPQIREMKARELVIICDGYDESQQSQNLYESNGFNEDGGWHVQMIVSCRSDHLGQEYRDHFQPSRSSPTDPDLLKQAVLVPFSAAQIKDYIARYVAIKKPLWTPSDYESVLDQIPSLQDLIKNPFLLSLALEVLPRIADPSQTLTSSKITRVLLYDEFVAQWLERNKRRLAAQGLNDQERKTLENLSEDGFTQQGLGFLKDLSAAIYIEQDGIPVVEYSRVRDTTTWKEQFFGRKDEESQILRRAIPLTRNGSRFGFIHRSILEYGVSRAIYEPKQSRIEVDQHRQERRKSTDSTYSFEIELPNVVMKATETTTASLSMDSVIARRNLIRDSSVIQFLVERVQSEFAFKEQLFAYIHASKTEKAWRTAAANAMTILVRAGVHFSDQDLRGIQVPGADMSFGVFDSAHLNGADLRKTNLQSAWLRQTDLTDTRMEGARFGERPTLSEVYMTLAFAYLPDGKTFLAGTREGIINVYDTFTWAIVTTLEGHDGEVTDLVVSPDGMLVAAGALSKSDDKLTVRVWGIKTGQCLHVLGGHTESCRGIAFLPDVSRLVTASSSESIFVWDLETGTLVRDLKAEEGVKVHSIACSPDGRLVASIYSDPSIRLWQIDTSECLHVLKTDTYSLWIAFSPCGKQFSASSFYYISTLDVSTGTVLWTFERNAWTNIVYSPDGRYIAMGASRNPVVLDAQTGAVSLTLQIPKISHVIYSPDGTLIATASDDRTLRIWDASTGAPGPTFSSHISTVKNAVFSPSGYQIASSCDGVIYLSDTRAEKSLNIQPRQSNAFAAEVCFIPDQTSLMSFSEDSIRKWDRESGKLISCIGDGNMSDRTVISPCGRQAFMIDYHGSACLWNIETSQRDLSLELEACESIRQVAISDGIWLAATCSDAGNNIQVWNRHTGMLEHLLVGQGKVTDILFSLNGGHRLASFSESDTDSLIAHVYDMTTGQCSATIEGSFPRTDPITVYSSDGSKLLAAFNGGAVHTWDTTTGKSLRIIETGCENLVRFSLDGSLLITHSGDLRASGKGTLQVWDMNKGECVWVLGETDGWVTAGLSPDNQWLVSSSENDSAIRLWCLRTGKQIAESVNHRGKKFYLAVDKAITNGGNEGGDRGEFEFSVIAASIYGDISYWKIVGNDADLVKYGKDIPVKDVASSEQMMPKDNDQSQSNGSHTDNGQEAKTYKLVMKWTTEYGKLNAEGAVIKGVKGLGRVNTQLLMQYGAKGGTVLGFQHAVSTMTISKNFVSKFKARRSTSDSTLMSTDQDPHDNDNRVKGEIKEEREE
ncbi:hypothetical protein BGZ79_001035 [Entomortierella chlamydospora]|nr:hypothetical protein BGZ79_001035 [Entomortierella chlamydospora]